MAIYKLTAYDLICTAITDGNWYVTTDTKQVYRDYGSTRNIMAVTMVSTEAQRLNNIMPSNGTYYYVWETNTLWVYNCKWIVIEGSYSYTSSGYYYTNNQITPTDDGSETIIDNNGLLKDGSVVVRNADRIIKGKLYISNGETVYKYSLLTSKPADWDEKYYNYYVYVGSGSYEPNVDPTWAADTFYEKVEAPESVNNLIISSYLGGGIKLLPSGSMDSTGALELFSAYTYTGQYDGNGNPITTSNNGELVFYGDMYVTDGTNRFKVLTSRDGYTYEAGEGIILGNTTIYIMLLAEPDDWSTNYTDYFVFDSDTQQYVANTNPVYADDTYYVSVVVPNQIAVRDYSNLLKGVKVGGTTLTPDLNNMVDIPKATTGSLGVVQVGSGLSIDSDGVLSANAGGGVIDDTTTSLSTTWSSDKIDNELSDKADTSDIPTNTSELTNDGDGTYPFATTNDIPTVPTNVSAFNNDAGYITSADIPTDLSDFSNDVGFTVVSYTRDVSTGTKIGSITIDGISTDIYAPNGGGGQTYTGGTGITIDVNNAINVDNPLPASTIADEGKFLIVNASGNPEWTTIATWNGGNF